MSCHPWTIHSLTLHVPGRFVDPFLAACTDAGMVPVVPDRRRVVDADTGEVLPLPKRVHLDFVQVEEYSLLPLGMIARQLARIDWQQFPGVTVNRLDLATDHLLEVDPGLVRDRVAEVQLPYSRAWRGHTADGQLWETVYHQARRAGPSSVVVAHYPRLPALRHNHADAPPEAAAYARNRLRQEVRLKAKALRRCLRGGSMTVQAVLGSLPPLLRFAGRRLRPVFDAGILTRPLRDLPGEEAVAAAVRPRFREARFPVTRRT